MDQNRLLGLMALRDGFGSLRSIGGGPAGPQNALPMAMQYKAKMAEQEKLQQALQRAREGGAPAGVNPAAFDALASVAPGQALQMLASPASQPDPWRDKRVVGGSVVRATPGGGVESIYDAPQDDAAKAQSAIAKLTADYRAGLIDADTYKAARAKALRDPNGITIGPDGTVQIGGTKAPTAITTEAIKGRNAFDSIMKGLSDYEKMSAEGGAIIPGKKKDRLDVARRSLQLQMKELFNLGVLNGPDLALMDQLLVDMTSIENNVMDRLGVADLNERSKANVAQLRQMMTDLIEPKLRSANQAPPQTGTSTQPSSGTPNFGEMSTDDLRKWIQENGG